MPAPSRTELNEKLDSAIAQLEQVAALRSQMRELEANGEAAEGLVRAKVGPTGHLIEITLDPQAMRLGSVSLSEAIMDAVRSAQKQLEARLGDLTDVVPRSLDVAGRVSGLRGDGDGSEGIRRAIERLRAMRG